MYVHEFNFSPIYVLDVCSLQHIPRFLYWCVQDWCVLLFLVADLFPDYTETASIATTEYSYHSEKIPGLHLLAQARTHYSHVTDDPFTGKEILKNTAMHRQNIDMDTDSVNDSNDYIVDPATCTILTSCKAYSGASKYKDFIRCLPVHLAKYILSFLDQASLVNALCVNQKWRILIEEVHQERFINQSLTEEVMLMQVCFQTVIKMYNNKFLESLLKLLF